MKRNTEMIWYEKIVIAATIVLSMICVILFCSIYLPFIWTDYHCDSDYYDNNIPKHGVWYCEEKICL